MSISSTKTLLPSIITIVIALIIGFSLGTIAERRGIAPRFGVSKIEATKALERAYTVPVDSLNRALKREGVVLGDGEHHVLVFTDFECPYCARFDSMTVSLISEGDFRFEYRHFPLIIHPTSVRKHRYLECVNILSAEAISTDLVSSLYSLPKIHDWSILELLEQHDLVVDPEQIIDCVDGNGILSAEVEKIILEDSIAAKYLQITGTPTWIVGNRRFTGSITEGALRHLSKEISK